MSKGKTLNIIFDGKCDFCIRSLKVLRALDVRGVLRFHDFRRAGTVQEFPILLGADVEDAMYAVAKDERPQRGFFAFRRVLWTSPLMWPLLPLFYFPGISFVGNRVYSWVARNRQAFGCESTICTLPTASSGAHAQHKE
jgi:predicted DCC family thiol-disulfide oxidoreductase YuxK